MALTTMAEVSVVRKGQIQLEELKYFAQNLAGNEEDKRTNALKQIVQWLRKKDAEILRKKEGLSRDDLLKVWRGLHSSFWMTDKKVQEEVSLKLSSLIKCFSNQSSALNFIWAFFKMQNENWAGLDKWRMDKFMRLIRHFLQASLIFCAKWHWQRADDLVRIFETECIDSRLPFGFRSHFASIFVCEVDKCFHQGYPISPHHVFQFVKPFCHQLTNASSNRDFMMVFSEVFKPLLEKEIEILTNKLERGRSSDDNANNNHGPRVDMKSLSMYLLQLASQVETKQKWRKQLYQLIMALNNLVQGKLPEARTRVLRTDRLTNKDYKEAIKRGLHERDLCREEAAIEKVMRKKRKKNADSMTLKDEVMEMKHLKQKNKFAVLPGNVSKKQKLENGDADPLNGCGDAMCLDVSLDTENSSNLEDLCNNDHLREAKVEYGKILCSNVSLGVDGMIAQASERSKKSKKRPRRRKKKPVSSSNEISPVDDHQELAESSPEYTVKTFDSVTSKKTSIASARNKLEKKCDGSLKKKSNALKTKGKPRKEDLSCCVLSEKNLIKHSKILRSQFSPLDVEELPDIPEKQAPKKQIPEKQAPKKQVPEKQAPEKQVPEKQVPKKQVPEKQVPKKQVPEKQVPEKQAPEKPIPKKSVSKNQVSNKEIAKNQVSKKKIAKNQVSKKEIAKNQVSKTEIAKNQVSKKEIAKMQVSKKEIDKKQVSVQVSPENSKKSPPMNSAQAHNSSLKKKRSFNSTSAEGSPGGDEFNSMLSSPDLRRKQFGKSAKKNSPRLSSGKLKEEQRAAPSHNEKEQAEMSSVKEESPRTVTPSKKWVERQKKMGKIAAFADLERYATQQFGLPSKKLKLASSSASYSDPIRINKKAVKRLKTPKSAGSKKVMFALKNNRAQEFVDSLKVSAAAPFDPKLTPSSGILKANLASGDDPLAPVRARLFGKRSRASDFF